VAGSILQKNEVDRSREFSILLIRLELTIIPVNVKCQIYQVLTTHLYEKSDRLSIENLGVKRTGFGLKEQEPSWRRWK
jgi:hypothetical protein